MKPFWQLEDIYSEIVVIGNGPSLADVPIELFEKYPTMGCNSVYQHEYFWEHPVDWYVLEGINHLATPEQRKARIPYIQRVAEHGGHIIINRRMIHHFQHFDNIYSVDYVTTTGRQVNSFQFDPFMYYGTGACVTYAMLQFAYYLASGTVLMVGMDHSFKEEEWHFFDDGEAPAFHKFTEEDYWKFRKRADPKLKECATVYEVTDRELINLTPNSEAKWFEEGDIDEWK